MITAVVGGQYGSEGKGAVVGHIARDYGVHVRVGAANAGHTVYVDGEKHVLQSIPVAAYANPDALLLLGPGALININILEEEIERNREWRQEKGLNPLRLGVDGRAHIVTSDHVEREQKSDLAERIGSTSTIAREGIGAAQAARVSRERECLLVRNYRDRLPDGANIVDVPWVIYHRRDQGVLLEGTQGTGLSLTTGDFPYVTSRNTTAAGLAADCGVGPRDVDRVVVVMRTYPIRVHGNSGPFFWDSREISWDDIGVPPERTTVTKLERRVATFSMEQVRLAAVVNSATQLALTFADYIAPSMKGLDDWDQVDATDPEVMELDGLITTVERALRVPVWLLGTGPESIIERLPERDIEGERKHAKPTVIH